MVTINKNEIRSKSVSFSKRWENVERERAEKDTFWNEFFTVFGLDRKNYAIFDQSVKKLNNNKGFIDLFWPGKLIVEHKSKGQNLNKAFEQASEYFLVLKENEKPKYIIVSDFENFKLYDLESSLADLYHPLTMPSKLTKAHNELDKAVDKCYRSQPFINETTRIEFLFELYNEYKKN